ncbi:MAG: CDP-glucose 4,6-dehydratase [Lachnospiraceae bacterium]|uniref:CDP-glucose 4,6-dehydratase n=1 Tax=Candidatus Weimeria bifida TaxID=2599074 RepID=A0A6N7J0R5_9FIRM|nr:CDP-glucose 4,6-dehydratase [Candidatus Weimeria bifida]RRF95984.1 MAG: CDP-glucose 4,6-dehydratase [Lachnospiraceae bacterium]
MSELLDFYKNKTVLVTGHTGFKGTWLTRILLTSGARVIGYSLKPPTNPSLFKMAGFEDYEKKDQLMNVIADIRDLSKLKESFDKYKPEIVFHLAAQPIVRDSYKNPVYTYETNVMGTVNVLECIRLTDSVRSSVIITTDKVYKNNEWIWGYREDEPLDGFDPYSNSKSCAELSVHSYKNSFFNEMDGSDGKRYCAVSTARAGNVIGGGDFANDRIIPDCVRAMENAVKSRKTEGVIAVRNPYSTRPYQHVLEPLAMYLTIAYKQWDDLSKSSYYNVGPDDVDCVTTGNLVDLFCKCWNDFGTNLAKAKWESHADPNGPHEANFLKLDSTKIKTMLGYKPRWHIAECMQKTVEFSKLFIESPESLPGEMDKEIKEFFRRL